MSARRASKEERRRRKLEAVHEFYVFQTESSEDQLAELVKSLETFDHYNPREVGIAVQEHRELRGLYTLFRAGPYSPWPEQGAIRVVGNQLWTIKHANALTQALRGNRIPYQKSLVEIKGEVAFAEEPQPIDLEGRVIETYTPPTAATPDS